MDKITPLNLPKSPQTRKKLVVYMVIGVICIGFVLFISLYRISTMRETAFTRNELLDTGDTIFYHVPMHPAEFFILEWFSNASISMFLVDDCGLAAYLNGTVQYLETYSTDDFVWHYEYDDFTNLTSPLIGDQYSFC